MTARLALRRRSSWGGLVRSVGLVSGVAGRLPGELAGGPGRRAGSAQRHVDLAQQVRAVLAGDHRVEGLADAPVGSVGPPGQAKAGPVPHERLNVVDVRTDLGTVRCLPERIEGRAHSLKRIGDGQPDPPADLGQGVSEFGVPVIAHNRILSLTRVYGQAMFTHLSQSAVVQEGFRSWCA